MFNQHNDWLSLVPHSGPFLAEPVLTQAFPQGLDKYDPIKKKIIRQAYDEWRDAIDTEDSELAQLHQAWINYVLEVALELDKDVLKKSDDLSNTLEYQALEHGITVKPDYVVVDDQNNNKPMLLIQVYEPNIKLEKTTQNDGWATTPAERMAYLCKATNTRLGLVSNGEHWLLVDAPEGGVTTYASWYSRLWHQEPITYQAFVVLLGVSRYFCEEERKLSYLIDESNQYQDEVTESLGEQVRRAVEVLIQALDKADIDRNRELLQDVKPQELYEAALTIMMRLVFLLSAEERDLLLLGDLRYEMNYAVSTLRQQLQDDAHRVSEEVLDHRYDAWSRLLSIFRAVYGGIEHESLRLPALGGSLFDPDRYPFLEGRNKNSTWYEDEATPLPIDNRTVLFMLEAIQLYQGRTLSYRALDVEQIGYVYEGLLERTAVRVKDVTLELSGTKSAKEPWVTLSELESAQLESTDEVERLLKERTGSSISRIKNDLKKEITDSDSDKLLSVCRGNQNLRDRIKPYFHLLQTDRWDYPLVYPKDAFMVATGSGRRETGTHYTPKSLTEAIVKETLEPIVYIGPAAGKPKEEWQIILPAELLDLKICDPAMGSGAFLVQVCRTLSDRLMESWSIEEQKGKFIDSDGKVYDTDDVHEPLNKDVEARLVIARRLIAERCLFGVDINPLAVELAKLSIWLVTLAVGRPFGFLDHNLRSGDSLLGITDLKQIMHLHINPEHGKEIHQGLFNKYKEIEQVLNAALDKRRALREIPILDINDVQRMKQLDFEAHELLKAPDLLADIVVGEALAAQNNQKLDERMKVRAVEAASYLEGDLTARKILESQAYKCLNVDKPTQVTDRHPFHWALEFPEVFASECGGFDAIVGNPPFLGGQKITGVMGTKYREFLINSLADGARGSADFVAYFFLLAHQLIKYNGSFGLLAVNTISEGDTRIVGLEQLLQNGASIRAAYPNEPWPGHAAVSTSRVHMYKGDWNGGVTLSGKTVDYISAYLSGQDETTPEKLLANKGLSFQGSIILGLGFTLTEEEMQSLLNTDEKNKNVLFPYINGQDLNGSPEQKPSRWVINFWDWPEEMAKEYLGPYQIVEQKVKPERQRLKENGEYQLRKPLPQRWWQYGEKRPALYHALGRGHRFIKHPAGWVSNSPALDRVLVIPETTKYCAFSFCKTSIVLSHMTKVIVFDDYSHFSLLSSTIHEVWARKHSSTLDTRLKYITSSAFETFPFPTDESMSALDSIGEQYYTRRSEVMLQLNVGITKLYNKFHDPECNVESIIELRGLHSQIDKAVIDAYGWMDIKLEPDFIEVPYLPENDRVRFTISEVARLEVLRRLSWLNKDRFDEESAQKIDEKKNTKKKVTNKKRSKKIIQNIQESLFGESDT